jgi:nitric oxide reductase NorE protein
MPDSIDIAARPAAAQPELASASAPRPTRHLPGDPGVWVFITADTFAFGLFFVIFTLGRAAQPELYRDSAHALTAGIGVLNTMILLTSGWLMVLAVEAARHGDRQRLVQRLQWTLLVASGFAVTKIYEYTSKVQAGITLLSNDFFMYYYVFTGIHFLHYLIGLAVLAVCLSKARKEPLDSGFLVWIESSASYWHMVDLLWIVLFPMLYLLR